jgi:uncharacterized membrane protein
MLLLKFFIPPLLICLLSLAEHKWGATISGALLGFPVTGGPVVFFLALEQGASFSTRTATASLQGLMALAAFALTYSLVARSRGWLASILVAILVFLAISAAILEAPLRRPGWAFLLTCGALLATLWVFPRFSTGVGENHLGGRELIWRMITAAVLVSLLTAVAPLVGPIASGLAVMVPVYTSILAVFNHMKGSWRAMAVLKGLVNGAFSSAIFFVIVALFLEKLTTVVCFGLAALACLAMQIIMLRHLHKGTPVSVACK